MCVCSDVRSTSMLAGGTVAMEDSEGQNIIKTTTVIGGGGGVLTRVL